MKDIPSVGEMKMDIKTIIYIVLLFIVLAISTYSLIIGSINTFHYFFFLSGAVFFIAWNLKDRWTNIKSNVDTVLREAEKAFRDGKYQEAISYYDQLLEAQPNLKKAIIGKVICYKHLAGYREAIPLIKEMSEKHPKIPEIKFWLGVCYFEGRYTVEAIETFNAVLAIDPNYVDVFPYLGDLHKLNKDNDLALEFYEKYLQQGKDEDLIESVKEKISHLKNKK